MSYIGLVIPYSQYRYCQIIPGRRKNIIINGNRTRQRILLCQFNTTAIKIIIADRYRPIAAKTYRHIMVDRLKRIARKRSTGFIGRNTRTEITARAASVYCIACKYDAVNTPRSYPVIGTATIVNTYRIAVTISSGRWCTVSIYHIVGDGNVVYRCSTGYNCTL